MRPNAVASGGFGNAPAGYSTGKSTTVYGGRIGVGIRPMD